MQLVAEMFVPLGWLSYQKMDGTGRSTPANRVLFICTTI